MGPVLEPLPSSLKEKKLLEQMRDVIRLKHYSIRTEQCYCDWVERFIRYHRMRHPREMREVELTDFLTHLAREGRVAAFDPESGLERAAFPLQRSPEGGRSLAGGRGARE